MNLKGTLYKPSQWSKTLRMVEKEDKCMKVELEPIAKDNIIVVMKLEAADVQKDFIAALALNLMVKCSITKL